jgi:transcriptional regulator with XRE-family HTH domain
MEQFIQENMKIIRNILDYTQTEFADILGISRVYLGRLENSSEELGRTVAIAFITIVIQKHKEFDKDSMRYKLLSIYVEEFQDMILKLV